jgi:hypothetical protein
MNQLFVLLLGLGRAVVGLLCACVGVWAVFSLPPLGLVCWRCVLVFSPLELVVTEGLFSVVTTSFAHTRTVSHEALPTVVANL